MLLTADKRELSAENILLRYEFVARAGTDSGANDEVASGQLVNRSVE